MIKIEVTGNSIPEVADKLIAIGHSLLNAAVTTAPAKGKPAKKIDAKLPELAEEIVFAPDVTVGNAPSEVASSGTTEASPTAPSGTEPETPTTGEPETVTVDTTYLRDLVLTVVDKRGKPFMAEILERFGLAKASQVAPEHAAELIATMLEALGK